MSTSKRYVYICTGYNDFSTKDQPFSIAECSYDGSATQVDLFNLTKLNETVDILQKRVQSIESDIKDVCSNTQYVANEVRMTRVAGWNHSSEKITDVNSNEQQHEREYTRSPANTIARNSRTNGSNNLLATSNAQWSLSLTPKGLRIDTNIASLHDLYDILLSGVSQFDLSNSACMHESISNATNSPPRSSGLTSCKLPESPRPETATVVRKKPLWRTRLKIFPLYSSWEPHGKKSNLDGPLKSGSTESSSVEISTSTSLLSESISKETLHHMLSIFCECFLCFPCPEPQQSVLTRFENETLDPLLANAVFAWTARHAAIYHNLFPGKDPNQVGQGFFLKAKSLVKDCFTKASIDTMQSLLIMYIYAIGIPSERKAEVESEAYMYLGVAIRMCLDFKMDSESSSPNPFDKERNRRFYWVLHFLETLGSVHSDKPFALPSRNNETVQYPTLMEHEKSGEIRYRVKFIIERFKITHIYRKIIDKTTKETPLLSQISAIDKELQNWKAALPSYLQYETGDIHRKRWDSTSFRDQACIKLNFEYNFQLCQLYGLFFSKSGADENNNVANLQQPSAVEVLSREICLKAAGNTVELLECWAQLKQLWCHFSLENLMMTTMIYGNSLTQANGGEREIATKNLEKIAKILLNSPVRHHKYVLTLVGKIRFMFKEILNTNLQLDGKFSPDETLSKDIDDSQQQSKDVTTDAIHIPATESSPQGKQQQQIAASVLPSISSTTNSIRHGQHARANSIPINTAVPDQSINYLSLTNQFNQKNSIYDAFDVASASSAFDMNKAESFSERMHFSDFVYTPTLLDHSDSVNGASMLSTVTANSIGTATYGQRQRGKKRNYTAEMMDDNCQLQQQSQQQQQYHYGYNANNTLSTCTTNNSPTQISITSPTWLEIETFVTQPSLLNHPTDLQQQYVQMNSNFNDNTGRQRYPTPTPKVIPSQQQPQQQLSPSLQNYHNNYNDSYFKTT
ncbi:hypothetical protein [Parasitella parasitica]|uniref:Xylanolytic transcriptional activator regulatory domain-containing protein n=1 Tax=Parasitella parasitica TaxID=35722 RepID=A0A0B7MZC0_9FUNG|nr:hypothetical protein [Parasitella parasitica]